MADISIPSPDAAGYWHFTYITTDFTDGRWYGGKRSTKKHPLSDPYKGSGNWIKKHPTRDRLRREIVAFYPTSEAVFAAEAQLVTWAVIGDDPLCMNLRDGGEGVSVEAALKRYTDPVERERQLAHLRRVQADPKVQAKMSASATLRYQNPEEHAKQTEHMRRITSDPVLLAKAQAARDTPTWRANVLAALEERRASDPDWRTKVKTTMLQMAADPEWYEARAAENRRMATDPKWRAAYDAGMKRRSERYAARRAAKPPKVPVPYQRKDPEEVSATRSVAATRLWADPLSRAIMLARQAAGRAAKAKPPPST